MKLKNNLKVSAHIMSRVFILVGLFLLMACTSPILNKLGLGEKNRLKTISIDATIDANHNTELAIDILFIKDEKLGALLAAMNGPEWFLRKKEMMMRYSDKITIASFEVVPLSYLTSISMPEKSRHANSILLFANYIASKGQYVSELKQYQKLKLKLHRDEYTLSEMAKL